MSMHKNINWALAHCRDQGSFPDIFPIDYGLDIKLETRPDLEVCARDPRRVKINISSFIGTTSGARHYYPMLQADGVMFKQTDKDGNVYNIHGYISEEFSQKAKEAGGKYDTVYDIMVTRPLSEEEISTNPDMWHGYSPGDQTDRFNDYDEAYQTALEVAKIRFPGWKIVSENSL